MCSTLFDNISIFLLLPSYHAIDAKIKSTWFFSVFHKEFSRFCFRLLLHLLLLDSWFLLRSNGFFFSFLIFLVLFRRHLCELFSVFFVPFENDIIIICISVDTNIYVYCIYMWKILFVVHSIDEVCVSIYHTRIAYAIFTVVFLCFFFPRQKCKQRQHFSRVIICIIYLRK